MNNINTIYDGLYVFYLDEYCNILKERKTEIKQFD